MPAGATIPGISGLTKTDLPREDAGLQPWSCRDARSLSSGLRELFSFSAGDVEDFCCHVKELWEEVSRVYSIRHDENKVDLIFSDTLQVQEPGLY